MPIQLYEPKLTVINLALRDKLQENWNENTNIQENEHEVVVY